MNEKNEKCRSRAGATVVEDAGSQAIYVSQPEPVAELIKEAADGMEASAQTF